MVISGGWYPSKSSTELLDVSEPNPQWRIVAELELPVPLSGLKGVSLDGNFFISDGDASGYKDKIMRMTCNNGQCQLESMTSTLQVPRDHHIFLPLSESLAKCN